MEIYICIYHLYIHDYLETIFYVHRPYGYVRIRSVVYLSVLEEIDDRCFWFHLLSSFPYFLG